MVRIFANCVYSCFEKAGLLELMKRNRQTTWQKSFFYVFFFFRVVERRVFFPTPHFRKKNLEVMLQGKKKAAKKIVLEVLMYH